MLRASSLMADKQVFGNRGGLACEWGWLGDMAMIVLGMMLGKRLQVRCKPFPGKRGMGTQTYGTWFGRTGWYETYIFLSIRFIPSNDCISPQLYTFSFILKPAAPQSRQSAYSPVS